jgi:hypothetical protein
MDEHGTVMRHAQHDAAPGEEEQEQLVSITLLKAHNRPVGPQRVSGHKTDDRSPVVTLTRALTHNSPAATEGLH